MEPLWAPWRMEYVGSTKTSPSCVFCDGATSTGKENELLVVAHFEHSVAIMNKFPYANGHVMVAPRQHTAAYEELAGPCLTELLGVSQKLVKALRMTMNPDGFNLGFNLGRAAGAGIVDHLHYHIVPRWIGDTNFMPLLGETRVISEHISTTMRRLREALGKLQ